MQEQGNSLIYGATRECFACENYFKPMDALRKGVSLEYCEQYCSAECLTEFESALEAAAIKSTERELVTPTQAEATADQITKIINGFKINIKSPSSEK